MNKNFFQTTIDTAYDQYMKLQSKIKEAGFDQRYAEKIMNATDPNDEFLARKLLQLTSMFDEIGNMVQYLHKPVRVDGTLYRTADGWGLQNEKITDGCTLEFMYEAKWHIGKMKYDKHNKTYSIQSEDQKITCTRLDNLRVRIR